MKLFYSHNLNPRVAVAVARYLESPVEYMRVSPRHPDQIDAFRELNPNALVPVLSDGTRSLWETDAIACRLSEMAGSDFWRTGETLPEMMMWVSWSAYHLTRASDPLYFYRVVAPRFSAEPPNAAIMEQALQDFRRHAAILEDHLQDRKWIMGDRISYADFRVATPLPFAEAAGLPLSEFPNISLWHARLNAIDAWRDPFHGLQ